MAAIAIAAFLENGGLSYTADILRRVTKAMRETQGVAAAGDMAVSQNGTPNMSVNVAAGQAVVDGTQVGATQGTYVGTNDATANLSIAAADPTNPRIDIVVAQFEDSVYSGANNDFKLAVVTGTPAPSPSPPATPANAMVLAQVAVAANASSITNGNITDKRTFVQQSVFPGVTGVTFFDSTGALQNLAIADSGLVTLRNALKLPPSQNGTVAASSYGSVPVKIAEVNLGAPAASLAFTSIPSGFRNLHLMATLRADNASTFNQGLLRLNNDSTSGHYAWQLLKATGTAAPTANESGAAAQSAINQLFVPGANALANCPSTHKLFIPNYAGTTFFKMVRLIDGYFVGTAFNTTGQLEEHEILGIWNQTTAVNEIDMIPGSSANYVVGSTVTVQGEP